MDLATMKHATGWFIALVVGAASVALIVWTVMAGQVAKRSTVSNVLLETARSYPLFPLLAGLVAGAVLGHIFWPQYR